MFISAIEPAPGHGMSDKALLLEQLARASERPRYAFMLLNLIADVASGDGAAGPFVLRGNLSVGLRDWLCDALTPMGRRDPKRQALAARVRAEFERGGQLPEDPLEASRLVDLEVRDRVRASGKTNLSRAVTELVNAGLLKRHYQGFRVDHLNRGAQRQAVYTLIGRARCLIAPEAPRKGHPRQGELQL